MTQFLKKYYPSILTAVIILWLSLSDSSSINPGRLFDFHNSDKVAHFLIYGFFALILLLDSCNWKRSGRIHYIIVLIPVLMGVLTEVLQFLLTSTRKADFYDFLADIAGIACGVLFINILRKFYQKKVLD
jgi:VanZ family protein